MFFQFFQEAVIIATIYISKFFPRVVIESLMGSSSNALKRSNTNIVSARDTAQLGAGSPHRVFVQFLD